MRASLAIVCVCAAALFGCDQMNGDSPDGGFTQSGGDGGTQALEVIVQGGGHVRSSPVGIDCTNDCTARFGAGSIVVLTAEPAPGQSFSGWSGACTGTADCRITFSGDAQVQVTASFSGLPPAPAGQAAISVSRTGSGLGYVTSSPAGIDCGETCTYNFAIGTALTLTATPNAGYVFAGWGGACSGNTCTIRVSQDQTAYARFEQSGGGPPPPPPQQNGSHSITVSSAGSGAGRVTSSPGGIDCGSSCQAAFADGTTVTLTAQPSPPAAFTGWSGACNGNGQCVITVNADVSVTATFQAPPPQPPPPAPPPQNPPPDCNGIGWGPLPPQRSASMQSNFGAGAICEEGLADGAGSLALTAHGGGGATVATFADSTGQVTATLKDSWKWWPTAQPDGFMGPFTSPDPNVKECGTRLYDHFGREVSRSAIFYVDQPLLIAANAGNPSASGLTLGGRIAATPGAARPPSVMAQNENTSVRFGPVAAATAGYPFAVGVDTQGNSLLVADGSARFGSGAISAQWFDGAGRALTSEFQILSAFQPGPSTWFDLAPLIGGGLAMRRVDGLRDSSGRIYERTQWVLVLPSGQPSAQAAPQWLAQRPDTRLFLARGGRAYALAPEGADAVDCAQSVEIVSPAGNSCGAMQFRQGHDHCRTLGITVGRDGTVVQQTPEGMESGAGVCSWTWWPGALR